MVSGESDTVKWLEIFRENQSVWIPIPIFWIIILILWYYLKKISADILQKLV